MSLKDEVIWHGGGKVETYPDGLHMTKPIAVIPVEALRERLKSIANSGSHDYWEIGYCAAFKELLAELEGL